MFKTAKEVLANNNLVETVDVAVEINREVARLTKELELLKTALRDQGVAQVAVTGDNNITFTGSIGTAQVACVRPTPKAKKGVDLLTTENSLPAEIWSALFTKVTKVEFASDFEAKVAGLTTAQKAVVGNLVEMVEGTPRVTIK